MTDTRVESAIDMLLDEGIKDTAAAVKDMAAAAKNLPANVSSYSSKLLHHTRNAAISGATGGVLAITLGKGLEALAGILDADVEAREWAKAQLASFKFEKAYANVEDMPDEELYTAYLTMQKTIDAEIEAKFPLKGKQRWASALHSAGEFLQGRVGVLLSTLAMIVLFGKLTTFPRFTEDTND